MVAIAGSFVCCSVVVLFACVVLCCLMFESLKAVVLCRVVVCDKITVLLGVVVLV